jgi:uncharacterized protein
LSTLADRIRAIVKPPAASANHLPLLPDPTNPPDPPSLGQDLRARFGAASPRDLPDARDLPEPRDLPDHCRALPVLERTLGGEWRAGCFVVEHRRPASSRHGKEAVGQVAAQLDRTADDAALFTNGTPARPPFLFLDLETTGLSGGAGTLAFLVGCGWFDDDGSFVTRQFLLTRFQDERPLLERVAAELGIAGALVSFNGKSFDAPLLETRFLFHRMEWIGGKLPHVDVLHPARRFWKPPDGNLGWLRGTGGEDVVVGRPFRAAGFDASSCSLQALERQIVGARRVGDVPGFQIPGRYFQFVRSGDAAPLRTILEHNRLDLLTLAALTARLLHLTRTGPDGARDAREVLALGHVYACAGFDERARAAYRHAIGGCRSPRGAYDVVRIEALRRLGFACRRARLFEEAAACWSDLLEIRGCPQPVEREATAALAIHHEHRRRDLSAAKAFALRTLEAGAAPAWKAAARHRIARLDRKMNVQKSEVRSLKFDG